MSGDGKVEPTKEEKEAQEAKMSPEQLQQLYNQMKGEYDQIAHKIAEMEGEVNEHQLVLKALAPLETDRKCYRSIGGVLVETTANKVKPAVEESITKLEEVVKKLTAQAATKQKDISDFIEKHNVKSGAEGGTPAAADAAKDKKEKTGGVLA